MSSLAFPFYFWYFYNQQWNKKWLSKVIFCNLQFSSMHSRKITGGVRVIKGFSLLSLVYFFRDIHPKTWCPFLHSALVFLWISTEFPTLTFFSLLCTLLHFFTWKFLVLFPNVLHSASVCSVAPQLVTSLPGLHLCFLGHRATAKWHIPSLRLHCMVFIF